ncbi:hypothetical protein [Streptomyces spectabilis]|uniref:hypothetical protein n=1 Tax=Streptomyces spectabilis TaxID=68270 RepID=UPI001CEF9FDA|nr:hypothetical protein [Streptomyces spectabilis]
MGAGGPSSAGPTRALPAAYAVASRGGCSPAAGADRPPRESAAEAGPGGAPATVPAADAKRSSRESPAAAGPVSSFASSYNCAHQSAS